MECPYQNNGFCGKLDADIREALCAHCHIKRYAKWQYLSQSYWGDGLTLLTHGLVVFGEPDPTGRVKMLTTGIASPGDILSSGTLIGIPDVGVAQRDILCLRDCAAAVFDTDFIKSMFGSELRFARVVYENIINHCAIEKIAMLREVGCKDSYAAVRYVLDYCARRGIEPLTHEQIALVCNRRRPTVTRVLSQLTEREPELFS